MPFRMKHLLLSALFFAGLFPLLASASDRERIEKLEREVSQLRQQVSELTRKVISFGGKATGKATSSPPPTPSSSGSRTYTVQRGDSLWRIARKQGTTVARLEALNPGLIPRRIGIGKIIRVPGTTSPPTRITSTSSAKRANYTIKSGDTLSEIASRQGIHLESLFAANPGIDPRRLKIGKRIVVPAGSNSPASTPVVATPKPAPTRNTAPAAPAETPPKLASAPSTPTHPHLIMVRENRRLDEIAQLYDTDVATINELNQVSLSPAQIIKTGSQLYVPKR